MMLPHANPVTANELCANKSGGRSISRRLRLLACCGSSDDARRGQLLNDQLTLLPFNLNGGS